MHSFSYLVASCCDDFKMPAKHTNTQKYLPVLSCRPHFTRSLVPFSGCVKPKHLLVRKCAGSKPESTSPTEVSDKDGKDVALFLVKASSVLDKTPSCCFCFMTKPSVVENPLKDDNFLSARLFACQKQRE